MPTTLTHPPENDLETGDLLFPRKPGAPLHASSVGMQWSAATLPQDPALTVRDYLGPDRVALLERAPAGLEVSALLAARAPTEAAPALFSAYEATHALYDDQSRREMMLLAILRAAFPELLRVWLDMSINQFLRHPLRAILVGALEKEKGGGFFVGHVAMVLREQDGHHVDSRAGACWVIEANTTDFSHYRVSIHPYLVAGEPTHQVATDEHQLGRLRGWANRRLALGESVWHSRHDGLQATDGGVPALRRGIVDTAKTYLGRPYGFFDDPAFGDAGRVYCSEYVHRVFEDVAGKGLQIDQNRTWRWLHDHLDDLGGPDFVRDVRRALAADGLYAKMQHKAFFILTVHMFYRSAALHHLNVPDNEPYA